MNSTGTILEELPPILAESVPVAAVVVIMAGAAFNFRIEKRAEEKQEEAGNFDEKESYARCELLSKVAMGSAILLLVPYVASVAGLFTEIANIFVIALGLIWVVSTIISIFLL